MRLNLYTTIFLIPFALICFFSCSSAENDPFSKCRGGKPKPVFEGQYAVIDSQHFEIKGMEGIEQVWFENGMQMELLQLGCETIKQVFQFELPTQFGEEENWILLAASQFKYLSGVSEKHFEIGIWGQVIEQQGSSLFLGEKKMLQPGSFVKIDKIRGSNSTTLIVELSEE